jgi:multiple antibiotic resistance protein
MLLENAGLDFISELTRAILALFIIVDPLGNIPIFVGLTENITEAQRRKTFNTAMIVAFVLLLVFSFTGQGIFTVFGISINSFEVAGGVLLLIIAVRILISGFHERTESESPESLGAVPIAMPLLVGPGAITTTILNLQAYGIIITVLAVIVVLALTWVILRFIDGIYKVLGRTGSVVIARVMALIIAAIAVQFILVGITHFVA